MFGVQGLRPVATVERYPALTPISAASSFMVSPRFLAAALSSLSGLPLRSAGAASFVRVVVSVVRLVFAVVAVVMSLPPVNEEAGPPPLREETVPLNSESRWSGLSPGVDWLLRPMAGAAFLLEAVCGAGPKVSFGTGPVVHRAQVFSANGVDGRTYAMRVG